ncbi:MAG: hypothetical protein JO270_16870 [Acidobacteriaceae bacterium]|nr:hypothetical protein [Acidobacteriaceae bacterium]MBV8591325.1 hypothetical protein [Acetobacteraceae bacterium]
MIRTIEPAGGPPREVTTILFRRNFGLVQETQPDKEPAIEPESADPVYTAADLDTVRVTAWREGYSAGSAEAGQHLDRAVHQALDGIRAAFDKASDEVDRKLGRAADEIARLFMSALAVVLPTLSARYGEEEARAIVRTILPMLSKERVITIHVSSAISSALRDEISRVDPDFLSRVRVVAADSMLPGDVRVSWADGEAIRDAAALWREIEAVLAIGGLPIEPASMDELKNGD